MSIDIADNIIDKILTQVDRCEIIQFFGGEPTLNIEIIEYIVCKIKDKYRTKEIGSMPRFGIVTNGFFTQRDKIYDVLKNNNIETTISIDGPPAINDMLRVTKDGGSVYKESIKSINELIEIGVSVAMETVYTTYHMLHQYSIIDCMKFAKSNKINKLILQSAYPPASTAINPLSEGTIEKYAVYYMQAVDWWFNLFFKDNDIFGIYFKDILKIMLDGSPSLSSSCPAGITSYSIGPDGSIYPCQLLYGKTQFYMGNVSANDFTLFCKKIPEIHVESDDCCSCYARHWCQPCSALNDFFGDIAHPPKSECAIRKAVILRIAMRAAQRLKLPENEYTEILMSKIEQLKVNHPT